jgi:hypothetical protein
MTVAVSCPHLTSYGHHYRLASSSNLLVMSSASLARLSCYALLFLTAVLLGPALIPWFVHTDPIPSWYGPGAWLAYVVVTLSAFYKVIRLVLHAMSSHDKDDKSACASCTVRDEWDIELLASLTYTIVCTWDLLQQCWPILHSATPTLRDAQNPALHAAATAVYVSFGAAQVPIISFGFLLATSHGRQWLRQAKRAHRRRILIFIVLYMVSTAGAVVFNKTSTHLHPPILPTPTPDTPTPSNVPVLEHQIPATIDQYYGPLFLRISLLAFDSGLFRVLVTLPLELPWWANVLILLGVGFWPLLIFISRKNVSPWHDTRTTLQSIGIMIASVAGVWLYLPIGVPILMWSLGVSYSSGLMSSLLKVSFQTWPSLDTLKIVMSY